jgi:hypothetical protein
MKLDVNSPDQQPEDENQENSNPNRYTTTLDMETWQDAQQSQQNYWNQAEQQQSFYGGGAEQQQNIEEANLVETPRSLSSRRKQKQDTEEQMQFGLQTARVRRIDLIRNNVRRWEDIIQVLPFWKSEVITINIAFSLITIIALTGIVIATFASLPTQVPLVYQQFSDSWLLVDKSVLIVLIIGLAVIEFILIRLKRVIFDFDRRLSSVMALTQIFFNALAIIAMVQIVSLLLI